MDDHDILGGIVTCLCVTLTIVLLPFVIVYNGICGVLNYVRRGN